MDKDRKLLRYKVDGEIHGYAVRGHMDVVAFTSLIYDTAGQTVAAKDVWRAYYRIGRKPGSSDGEYWHVRSEPGHGAALYTVALCEEFTPRDEPSRGDEA